MEFEDIITWVEIELKERGWSRRELSRRSGISPTTISQVLNGIYNPTHNFCTGIAKAFGVSEQEVLWRAGLLKKKPPEVDSDGMQAIIDIARQLTPTQREYLAAVGKMINDGYLPLPLASTSHDDVDDVMIKKQASDG